jgi:glycosyltransferase involved in cell wall biosynthesis
MQGNKDKKYIDCLFVLPEYYLGVPPGGYIVLFQLSSFLRNDGYNVGFLFLRNALRFSPHESQVLKLKRSLRKHPIIGPLFEMFLNNSLGWNFLPLLRTILGINYENNDLKYLKGVKKFFNYRTLSKLKIDKIFAGGWETSFFVNYIEGIKYKYYIIHHSEDDLSHSGSMNDWARESYNLPLRKIVINQQMLDRFKNDEPLLFKDGVDLSLFNLTNPLDNRNNTILFPLRDFLSKGAKYALQMAESLRNELPEVEFLSFGDYSGPIPGYIKHYGTCSDRKLNELYNLSKIFVLPSVVEGFSIPTVQAMACGCAPVVTNCGGIREYIKDQENGLIVPVMEPLLLKDAVKKLLDDNILLSKISSNAYTTSKQFDLRSMYQSFKKALFDKTINEPTMLNSSQ